MHYGTVASPDPSDDAGEESIRRSLSCGADGGGADDGDADGGSADGGGADGGGTNNGEESLAKEVSDPSSHENGRSSAHAPSTSVAKNSRDFLSGGTFLTSPPPLSKFMESPEKDSGSPGKPSRSTKGNEASPLSPMKNTPRTQSQKPKLDVCSPPNVKNPASESPTKPNLKSPIYKFSQAKTQCAHLGSPSNKENVESPTAFGFGSNLATRHARKLGDVSPSKDSVLSSTTVSTDPGEDSDASSTTGTEYPVGKTTGKLTEIPLHAAKCFNSGAPNSPDERSKHNASLSRRENGASLSPSYREIEDDTGISLNNEIQTVRGELCEFGDLFCLAFVCFHVLYQSGGNCDASPRAQDIQLLVLCMYQSWKSIGGLAEEICCKEQKHFITVSFQK